MLREDQKELKMNTVTKFPTKVIDMIKSKYKKYIENCYKKNIHVHNSLNHHKQHKGKQYMLNHHKQHKGKH